MHLLHEASQFSPPPESTDISGCSQRHQEGAVQAAKCKRSSGPSLVQDDQLKLKGGRGIRFALLKFA